VAPWADGHAKVALWIETVEPGKPLSFLDAHLRCGDSLLGVYDLAVLRQGIPDEAYNPLTGDVKSAAVEWRRTNAAEKKARKHNLPLNALPADFLQAAAAIEAQSEDDLSAVETKAAAFAKLISGPGRHAVSVACDLYCAAFLLPKTVGPMRKAGEATELIPTSNDVWAKLAGHQVDGRRERKAVDAARAAHCFHWPLEFPQVFFLGVGQQPGFDLALGNPPWERIKLQEQEFFAARDAEIARAANKAVRQKLIDALAVAPADSRERKLHDAFIVAKRNAESASVFARTPADAGGRYPLTGTGDVNTYALFAELFATVARRAGVLVPTGIATDATTASFFAHLVEQHRLAAFIDFENREHLFADVYFRVRFCIIALAQKIDVARFCCLLTEPEQIVDLDRRFSLSPADVAAINPNTRTAPLFRSKADADLTRQIYSRVPVLIDESKGKDGNPWGVSFQAMFHMSNDSGLFRTGRQLREAGFVREGQDWVSPNPGERHVPLYEAKMIHHYNHRYGDFADAPEKEETDYREITKADAITLSNPRYESCPRYWVPEAEVSSRLTARGWTRCWLMGWRDICRATDERTVIAAAIPRSGVGNNLPLFFPNAKLDPRRAAGLLACLSGLTLDFIARLKVGGTHLNFFIAEQIAVPPPCAFADSDLAFIVPRVLELTFTSHSMKPFADDLGYSGNAPFRWDEDQRALLRAELDARIARLYGITRDQLRYILDPIDVYGPTYPSETFRVLQKNERAKYGEYRTARLVLDAWDRMERGEL
jgi:hypothetical protein